MAKVVSFLISMSAAAGLKKTTSLIKYETNEH
jgi:hypothetical protein